MNSNQDKLVDRIDRTIANIADWSIRYRLLIALLTVVSIGISLFFASTVRVDNSLDSFFYKDDPAYLAYQDYLDDFVSDEVIYLMYSAKDKEHGPFNIDVMRSIADLTEAIEREVPFVREANSLANAEIMRAVGDNDIEINDLLIDFPESQQALLKHKELLLSKKQYINYLISENTDYATIIIQMERSATDKLEDIIYDPALGEVEDNLYPVVSDNKIREILARPEYANQGIEFHMSGDVSMNATYHKVMIGDVLVITLMASFIIILVCIFMFPATFTGIIGPLAVIVVSVVLTIGFIGSLGWSISQFFTILPTLLCAVGVAQSVHIILEYQRQFANTGNRNQSVKRAFNKVGGPCLVAALTTAAGFAVMSVSNLRMLAEFGVYSAFGILLTFILSSTLLVIFLSGSTKEKHLKKQASSGINPIVLQVVEHVISINQKYPKIIISIATGIFIISCLGITQLRNDFNFLEEFKPHVEWREHTEKIENEMGGTLRMSYLIDTGIENGVRNPELIKRIDQIQQFANQLPLVKKSLSLADVIKDISQTFNGDDKRFYKIPDQQDLLAQYFLVYEVSGGKELEEFVSHDFSRTVIEFQIEMTYASEVRKLSNEIDNYVAANPLPNAEGRKTGIGLLWVKLAKYIGDTQAVSYSLVFTIIALFMCISFGSIKVGLLSMIANLSPVILALGVLGWLSIPLDYLKLLLATIAIGIAVDDTIHLVTRFRARFFETGNYQQAMQMSLRDVGPALIITSVILVSAFSMYLLSNTVILASFGFLLGGTIIAALIADLFLMPVILLTTKPFGPEFTPAPTDPQ